MVTFFETLVNGITLGCLYALIALGYTMVYGTLKFINFAHASVFMLGAWISYEATAMLGWIPPADPPPWWGVIVILFIAMAICGVLGFAVERLAYKPLRNAPRLNVLITAIGVAMLLENWAALDVRAHIGSFSFPLGFGTQPLRMPAFFADNPLIAIDVKNGLGVMTQRTIVSVVDVLVIGLAAALMIALQFLVYGTKLGAAMRAVSQDPRTAALMGIPVDRVISITFVVGTVLAAAAGLLFTFSYPVINQPSDAMWVLLGLKAFVAAVVGGIGNIRGAVVGGLLIGLAEILGATYLSPALKDVYVFSILIAVLLIKPTGIFPSGAVNKV